MASVAGGMARAETAESSVPSQVLDTSDPDAETQKLMQGRSQEVMQAMYRERERIKKGIVESQTAFRQRLQLHRVAKQQDWKSKMDRSPFLVNLIAESERIDEEHRARVADAAARERTLDKRRSKVKNDIILKALQEASDLEALRAEKRLIIEEERRLKALIEVEKTNLNRKQDLMAATRAEKERKQMQFEFRRNKRMQFEKEMKEQHKEALREKLGLAAADTDDSGAA